MSHLFSKENIDFTHEPLFLGSGRNVARLDLNIEQHIQKQVDDALGLMWFATDFTFGGDAKDYFKMDEKLSRLYLKNLKQNLNNSLKTMLDLGLPIASHSVKES